MQAAEQPNEADNERSSDGAMRRSSALLLDVDLLDADHHTPNAAGASNALNQTREKTPEGFKGKCLVTKLECSPVLLCRPFVCTEYQAPSRSQSTKAALPTL